jgi:hypothetical protein
MSPAPRSLERSIAPPEAEDFGDVSDGPSELLQGHGGPLPYAASKSAPESQAARREIDARKPPVGQRAPTGSPYLLTLDALARELDAQGRGRVDTAAIRLIRQRLTEWVEDLRSVGTANELAAAVEQLVQRLSAVLALSGELANEAIAIAVELSRLAAGGAPPKPSRAFWK